MKRILLIFTVVIAVTLRVSAADALTESLQKGLFEEEANHNLDAAIKAYQDVLARADEQRRVAATALFRLAECYRKQGKTNEATTEYRRLLRDYADQSTLATLSRQNLTGLGAATSTATPTDLSTTTTDEEQQEIQRIRALIKNSPDLINARNRNLGNSQIGTVLHEAAKKGHLLVAEYLLANGAQVNAEVANNAITPLYYAAENGHKRVVELLLAKGASPNGVSGYSPLFAAAQNGFRSVAEVLLAHKANVNGAGGSWQTPLHQAVFHGHFSIAELLIERGANLNAHWASTDQRPNLPIPDGTPLHFAVQLGKSNFIRLLLEKGANPNARSSRALHPLHYSAHLKNPETAEILIEHKAEVDTPAEGYPYRGWTSLLIAVYNAATNVAELLLEKGANPNVVAETQVGKTTPTTPLHQALEKQSVGIAKLLLDRGADVNARPTVPALFIAIQKNDPEMVDLLLRYKPDLNAQAYEGTYTPLLAAVVDKKFDIAELLLKSGADPNVTNNAGNAAIHRAVDAYDRNVTVTVPVPAVSVPTRAIRQPERSPELPAKETKSMLELLLDHKADPNLRNKDGNTPLQLAVWNSKSGAVELLLARNADPNASGKDGDKALHFAVRAGLSDGATEITSLLLQKKADANATNAHGAAPLHHISSRPSTNTLALLVKHGANVNACDNNRETPLHKILKAQGLAYEDTQRGVRFLLEHGADVLRSCAGGTTPFDYETRYGARSATIDLLRSYLPKKYAGIRLSGPVQPRFWFWEPDEKLTLSDLFKSVALQEQADPRQITILREDPRTGLKRQESHNLVFIREKITPDVPVQDGDQIFVATRSP